MFLEDLEDHNGVIVNTIDDPPGDVLIIDTKFVTPLSN